MQLDHSPFFRKTIIPWYDTTATCWVLMLFMLLVFVFAVAGVVIATGDPEFRQYDSLPGFLAFLSLFVLVKVFFRIRRRYGNSD